MITPEQRVLLEAPFADEDHAARPLRTNNTFTAWAIYIQPEAILRRLREVCPDHSWFVMAVTPVAGGGWVCHRRLTVGDLVVEDVGADAGGTAENAKMAATDAVRRTARLVGVGMYAWEEARTIRTKPVPERPSNRDEWDLLDALTDEALQQYLRWFRPWAKQWHIDHGLTHGRPVSGDQGSDDTSVLHENTKFISAVVANDWSAAMRRKYPTFDATTALNVLGITRFSEWQGSVAEATRKVAAFYDKGDGK